MIYGRKIWGPKFWSILHSFSFNNNLEIKERDKGKYYIFYTSIIYIIPCKICSSHYSDIINYINPLIEEKITKEYLIKWVFDTHNIINQTLNKNIYDFKIFLNNNNKINNIQTFFMIDLIYSNFDYTNISLYTYDQIYNFFLNFCLLYPDEKVKKNLRKLIKNDDFKKIQIPSEFKTWFIHNKKNIKKYLYNNENSK